MKKLTFFLGLVGLAGLAFWVFHQLASESIPDMVPGLQQQQPVVGVVPKVGPIDVKKPTPTSVSIENSPDPKFSQWLESQALNIDKDVANSKSVEHELAQVAEALTVAQISVLKKRVENIEASSGERILAHYLLAQGNREALAVLVQELLQLPRANPVAEADSLQELQAMGEKSQRTMDVDLLLERARKKDSAALDALRRISQEALDLRVRRYASNALSSLNK